MLSKSKLFWSLFALSFMNHSTFVYSTSSYCSQNPSFCSTSGSVTNHHHRSNTVESHSQSRQRGTRRKYNNGHHRTGWISSTTLPSINIKTANDFATNTEMPQKKIIDSCSKEAFESCLALMHDVMQNSSLAFPTNQQELKLTCRKLKAGDFCAERYIRSCVGDQQRLLYQDIVHGTKNVIRLICQQGDTQKQYLKFASCFKDISQSEQKCAPVLNRFQRISELLSLDSSPESSDADTTLKRDYLSDDEILKQFCCSYRDVVECQTLNVRMFCGEAGLEFFDRYNDEMTGPLIKEHCVGYTYGKQCGKTHRNFSNIHQENMYPSESILENSTTSTTFSACLYLISFFLISSQIYQ